MQTNLCEGVGGIPATDFENFILSEMKKKLSEFESLTAPPQKRENPRMRELSAKVEQIEIEIGKLLNRVADADSVLMGYINARVKELHNQASEMKREIGELAPLDNQNKPNIKEIRDCMQNWDELEFDDKRAVVDQLITKIKASQETCEIIWKL